ncbi:spermidine synthase [Hydrogenophaga sp.]|jgi:spermidine synthase|uniref:spermidine synthase n=1 Tax=Hydrogenophaga sp. TaxID=1904254 RepID=UPI003F6FB270
MKAGANAAARQRRAPQTLPEVTISEDSEVRFLHLGTEWIQGSMLLDAPFDIELDYVQRMMAWLLFVEPDSVSGRRALQLGLGSAALTKFCFKKLRMDTTAIEINPQVLAVCRAWFKLPADGPRLRVLLADAGEEIRRADHIGAYDALQVDLYDHEAAAPVLDSPDFYADCRAALSDDGCLTVNLFGRDASYERSLQSICAAFGADAVWAFKPTREGNTVVLAQRTPGRPSRMALLARAEVVQTRWGLPAVKWLRLFKPVS